jgi:hypothetical protein
MPDPSPDKRIPATADDSQNSVEGPLFLEEFDEYNDQ